MMLSGTCWPLQTLERDTSASESGSPDTWPTVTINGNNNRKGASPKSGDGLMTRVRERESSWPTPNARDWKDTGATQGNRHSPNLGTAVHTHTQQPACLKYPTPQCHDAKAGTTAPHGWEGQKNLNDLVLTLRPDATTQSRPANPIPNATPHP